MSYKSGVIDIGSLETLEISNLAGPIDIEGFQGAKGKLTLVTNNSAENVTLKHLTGAASTRITVPGGADTIVGPGEGVLVFKASLGWNVLRAGYAGLGTLAYHNASGVTETVFFLENAAKQAQFSGWSTLGGVNIFNGEIMIGALPYGLRISADPALGPNCHLTNMYDAATSGIVLQSRGSGTPVNLAVFNQNGNTLYGNTSATGTLSASTGSFANLNTTNDNSGVFLMGRYSLAFPHAYTVLRAGGVAYIWQNAGGVDLLNLSELGVMTVTKTAAGVAFKVSSTGGNQTGYFYSGASKFWMAAEASVYNAWGVYDGAGISANGNIEAWAGGSVVMSATGGQLAISRPVTITGAMSAFQGRQTVGAFSVDPRAGSPGYFVINTKIPFSDGRAPLVHIRGFMYASTTKVCDSRMMWYVYLGAFSQHQVLHTPGSYAPAIRLDKYNSGGTDYVRIEIENGSEYWTQWHVSVDDTFANINDYIGWSVADGTLSAPTAAAVTVTQTGNFKVNRAGQVLAYQATGLYFAGTTGIAIGGATPALCFEGSTTRWLNYVSAGTLLAWYNGSVDRMHLSAGGELSINFIRPVNTSDHVIIGKGAFNALRITPQADAAGLYLSATDSTGVVAYKPITVQGSTVSLIETGSSKSLTLTSSGGVTINNTTLTVGGTVAITTATAYLGLTSSTGTNASYMGFINTGGSNFIGAENSAGSSFSATAYDMVAYFAANRGFSFIEAGFGKVARFNRTTMELYFPTVAAIRAVLLGAADSAGAGYRTVRVAN